MENIIGTINLGFLGGSLCSAIFTDNGIMLLHLVDPKSPEFKMYKPHSKDFENALIDSARRKIQELKNKDKDYILSLNPNNRYINYIEVTAIVFGTGENPSSVSIFARQFGRTNTITSLETNSDIAALKTYFLTNKKDMLRTRALLLPRPKLLLKFIGIIIILILAFTIISLFIK